MRNNQWFNLVLPPNPRKQDFQRQQHCHREGEVKDHSDLDVEVCGAAVRDLGKVAMIEGGLQRAVRGRINV